MDKEDNRCLEFEPWFSELLILIKSGTNSFHFKICTTTVHKVAQRQRSIATKAA
jgi:hypothetical protein